MYRLYTQVKESSRDRTKVYKRTSTMLKQRISFAREIQ